MSNEDRIDYNQLGVDDVVINDVELFRLERMTDNVFWICCYKKGHEQDDDDNKRIVFWASVVGGKLIVKREGDKDE